METVRNMKSEEMVETLEKEIRKLKQNLNELRRMKRAVSKEETGQDLVW